MGRFVNIAMGALLGLLLGFSVYQGILNAKQGDALCTFRKDLQERVRQSEGFLREHPQGFAGIPAATIRQSLEGQKRTIKALQPLAC